MTKMTPEAESVIVHILNLHFRGDDSELLAYAQRLAAGHVVQFGPEMKTRLRAIVPRPPTSTTGY